MAGMGILHKLHCHALKVKMEGNMEYLRRKDVLEAFEPYRPLSAELLSLRERIKLLPRIGMAEEQWPVKCPICREALDMVVNYCLFCGERLRIDIGYFI